jgi:glutamate dehydrogenase (NAD(P)+)
VVRAQRRALKGLQVAIQGFGNVGSWMAREMHERGAVVIAISDVHSGYVNPAGIDIPPWWSALRPAPRWPPPEPATRVTNEELLEVECDVLSPAALGEVISDVNADRIRASVVLEAANYPVTPGGDKILRDRGVTVIPDILANAGGVTGSYFEWSQNIQQFTWKEERFNAELLDKMQVAFQVTQSFADDHDVPLRQAAYAIGIQRVADAVKLRGYI